jgi:3-oxoacyl-[acyl-carrier protein] reductase
MNYLFLGVGGGIGKSILNKIYNEEDNFILIYYSKRPNIKKKNIFLFEMDFNKTKNIKIKISEIIKKFKSIDILINNVGNSNPYKSALEMKLNEIEQSMRINFYSALFIILQVIKKSIKTKKKLNIINISSNTIKFYGSNNNLPYLVSKNALEVALLNLSKTYSRKIIKINIIRPGLIDSNRKINLKNYSQKMFLKRQKLVPIGKAGDPEDISNLVNFLISNNSKFIFGQIFTVSGGE